MYAIITKRLNISKRSRIAEINIDHKGDYDLRTSSLRKLKEIEDRLLFRVAANVRSNISVVEALQKASEILENQGYMSKEHSVEAGVCLQYFLSRLRSHKSSTETLEKRLVATISFVSQSSICFVDAGLLTCGC